MRAAIGGLAAALAACAALSAQVQTPAGTGLKLDDAVTMALAGNKTIAAAKLRRPVGLAGVDVARERPNPDISYESSRETPKQAVGVTFPLELGGKRGARTSAAEAAVATGDAEIEQVIATVLDDVRRTYISLGGATRRVAIAEELVGLLTRARDAAHARFQAGEVPQRDDVAAQVDLLSAQSELLAAHGEVDATRASLNVLLGQPPQAPLTLAVPPEPAALPVLDAAMAQADQVNADLKVLDRRIDEQNARVNLAKALQKPDAGIGGGVTFDAEPEFGVGWRANFGITLPIFTTHKAGVLLESAELQRLHAERDAVRADIGGAVAAALARADAALSQVTAYNRDILPLTRQDEAFAQDAYQSGQTGIDVLILALQRSRDRRMAGLQSLLDYYLALADLERAIRGPVR
jgi:cobalt-zinc-cadmium efflux system outer membrane protein